MNIYLIIFTAIIIVAGFAGTSIFKKRTVDSLENALLYQDFDVFDKKINKWYLKFMLPPFNIDYLKLNRALMGDDNARTDECFAHFDEVNLNEDQKEEVYMKGFVHYISREDRAGINKYYDLIKDLDNEELKAYADCLYDIYVLNGWKYLDDMISMEDTVPGEQLTGYYFMIYSMYLNRGDEENAAKYLEKISSGIEEG